MLETTFLNLKFKNPLLLASGVRGVTAASLRHMVKKGCGGVTLKSVSLQPRAGHPNPTMVSNRHFIINAIGLSNPGVDEINTEITQFKKLCTAPLIASVFAGSVDEFVRVAEKICETNVDALELNLSCPNVTAEFGEPFAYSIQAVAAVTKQVKAKITTIPLVVKLSPQAWNIAAIAKAAEDNGANAINAINTISGMVIDIKARQPILHNKIGGVSGPALFPIALRCVHDIFKVVKIPIIGTGGITTWDDAIAMIMVGATLLGIGSAVYYRGQTPSQGERSDGEKPAVAVESEPLLRVKTDGDQSLWRFPAAGRPRQLKQ
ncbi:Dihydroorotate dehydrogenase B (NAD(+)), catalytic subunit [Gammaproteobacteria bacterium]